MPDLRASRAPGGGRSTGGEPATRRPGRRGAPSTGGAVAAGAWAVALELLSLVVVRPNPDDAQYVPTATWVAERGTFPVRDILCSDQRFEALFFPPWTSIEALHGCVARLLAVGAIGRAGAAGADGIEGPLHHNHRARQSASPIRR